MDNTTTTNTTKFFGVQVPKVELPKIELPKVDLPKFDMPKFDMPKFDFPKVELPKVDFSSLNGVAETVKTAASDTVLTASQAATKVRNSATHTVTLVREAVGL